MLWPRGGSSSTVTTNSPAASFRSSRVGGAAVRITGAWSGRATAGAAARPTARADGVGPVTARMARMCSGVVPQQPPTTRAPAASIRAA